MGIRYQQLKKKPLTFQRLVGVKVGEFQVICEKVRGLWIERVEKQKRLSGRPSRFTSLEERVLALLIYYRTYVSHEFIGYLFNVHSTNVCRLFKRLEPLMARKFVIRKDRSLNAERVLELLADVTEQPIQRPKQSSKQKGFYSGKKKRHTRKVEIVMEATGRIVSVSKSYPGRRHDVRIRKTEKPLPRAAEKWVDSGYQGLQKRTPFVWLPFKRRKKQALTPEQKRYNQQHASFRVRVEHKIRELKVFKILSDTYRNFGKKHHLRYNIVAGILNLRYGF
jgi:hypothetical protein